ncbi:MAG: FkbM family methyltransferase [Bacteroidetes bacterium]|nr:FkbM family methyltransferase [Bacteroidota bacterium]
MISKIDKLKIQRLFIKVLNKSGLAKKINLIFNQNFYNTIFKTPLINGVGLIHNEHYEPWMNKVLQTLLKIDSRDFIDVGVNIGQTLLNVRSIDKDRNYIGFEPNPTCINYVMELIKINDFKNTTLIPFGIAGNDGVEVLHFFDGDTSDSTASILTNQNDLSKIKKTIFVPVATCKTIAEKVNLQNSGIIKIDVEGAELEVLTSMGELINQTKSYLILEVLPAYNAENKYRIDRQNKIYEFIEAQNYLLYRIKIDDNNHLNGFDLLQGFDIHSNMKHTNYVLVAKENQKTFEAIRL